MSEWAKNKRKDMVLHRGVTPESNTTKSVSKSNPNDPVTGRSPMSLKINQYHDDIITAGAKKMGVSKQQFVRIGFAELAEKIDIF